VSTPAFNQHSNKKSPLKYLGIDAGGTFTDFVLIDQNSWQIHKVLSTPDNPAQAILNGIADLKLTDDIEAGSVCIIHGSTVATNAVLERKGAKTVYVTNKGFKDILTIGRQARKELYNLNPKPPVPPVPANYCLEVDCRRDAQGKMVQSLSQADIKTLLEEVKTLAPESVAINLLFSFLNDDEEKQLEAALEKDYFVSRSSFVLPKYKEYERGMATWLNASLGPKVSAYIEELSKSLPNCSVSIMQSSGGTIAVDQAAKRAVNLLLSGPAGGLSAIRTLGKQCNNTRLMSFDMGGTSTDVALMDGDFQLTDEGKINDWPVAIPMLEMETIGAGGGSIAWLDEVNMLHVGPQSAGSKPGPACYGLGGEEASVSDANVVLGRLRPEAFLGGAMTLDASAANSAVSRLSKKLDMTTLDLATGVLKLAEQQMVRALHSISIQKGYDPSDFILCCFGGAGGMHVCELAEQMSMAKAIIPANSGVLSAYGMLTAPRQRQLTKTYLALLAEASHNVLDLHFQEMATKGYAELVKEQVQPDAIKVRHSLDLRYQGQSFTLNIPYSKQSEAQFIHQHQHQYGHTLDSPVEVVNLCVSVSADAAKLPPTPNLGYAKASPIKEVTLPLEDQPVPVYQREQLGRDALILGPAIIIEKVSTTWLKAGWQLSLDAFGHMHLSQI